MHELSLALEVLRIAEEASCRQGFRRVRSVWLEIGQLSAVDIEAMRFCLDSVMAGTLADGAALHVIEVPGQGLCFNCEKTVPLAALYDPCPDCGRYPVQATGGCEMRVRELEVE